jgi:hypothetical protein
MVYVQLEGNIRFEEVIVEWLLLNSNSAICQLYYGENKLIFNEMMMRSVDRHVAPLVHIILILSQPVFYLSP